MVSSVLLSATFASLFAGALSDIMGRGRAVGIGSAWFALGAALEAGASNLGMIIAGRLVVGVGEGLFLSTLVVYVPFRSIINLKHLHKQIYLRDISSWEKRSFGINSSSGYNSRSLRWLFHVLWHSEYKLFDIMATPLCSSSRYCSLPSLSC